MVQTQLATRGIYDPRVLAAMAEVPRHLFVPPDEREGAYEDHPLPIGHEQTISQPFMVALMAQALTLTAADLVLEIGTGSGYSAAVLSLLARAVVTIERVPELAAGAARRLANLGYANVEVLQGDGSLGAPARAPFAAIVVTAAAPRVPRPLKEQLADGGRLVIPVGVPYGQDLMRLTRRGTEWAEEFLAPVMFVPLLGEHGWR
jgi:protein-L-isoaspartate(D-aspartate) O-methyltransferase